MPKPYDDKPGETFKFNPMAKPSPVSATNARAELTSNFLSALAYDFTNHGKRAIERARIHDPLGYVKVIAQLLPKQVEQSFPLQGLSDTEIATAIEFLRTRTIVNAGKGSSPARKSKQVKRLQTVPETISVP